MGKETIEFESWRVWHKENLNMCRNGNDILNQEKKRQEAQYVQIAFWEIFNVGGDLM